MKKIRSIMIMLGSSLWLVGQQASPTVVSSGGGFASTGSMTVSYTVGEISLINTATTASNIYTQGFEQSDTPTVSNSCTAAVSVTCNNTNLDVSSTRVLTATPVNGGTRPTYVWYKNGAVISGATSSVLSYGGGLGNGDQIYCTMTPTTGCATAQTAMSNVITFTKSGSSAKEITTLAMPNQVGTSVISSAPATVSAVVTTPPAGRTAIHPTRLYTTVGASYGPSYAVNRDFSQPVTYTVTAQDGSTKIWTVTVVDQTGHKTNVLDQNGVEVQSLKVYPDPSADYIIISAQGGVDAAVITVLDMTGRVMYNQQLPAADKINHQIDLTEYASGEYVVMVARGQTTESKQFLIVK